MAHNDGKIVVNGKKLTVVTIDFETFYDKTYTLAGKMNMSEYVRDDRFHAHGVGIKIGNGETLWYTGRNIPLALNAIDWSKCALLAHNTPFDGFICSHHLDIVPAFYLDTLSIARAVHGHHTRHDLDTIAKLHGRKGKEKKAALVDTKGIVNLSPKETMALGAYCVDDVEDTYHIFWKMYDHVPDAELLLIDLTIRMFCDPVLLVDMERVQAELTAEVGGKAAALLKSGAQVEDLMSNEKFAELLKQAGMNPPMKLSPTTGKLAYAFAKSDLEFQKLGKSSNPKVVALYEARLKVKSTIGETRAARFLEAGKNGWRLPILLNYSGAHTHRWSGGNKMNLQNLKRGGELRRSILAPKGHVVVVADSAQIEARVLAWLAKQDDVVEAFAQKRDLYSEFASVVYNRKVDRKRLAKNDKGEYLDKFGRVVATKDEAHKPDELEGFIGKVCILGLGYGMGYMKLHATLKQGVMGPPVDIPIEECKRIVHIYRSRNSKIKALWRVMDGIIAAMLTGSSGTYGPLNYGKGYLQLPNGLFLQYYGLHGEAEAIHDELVVTEASYLTRNGRTKLYGGLLTENVVQALSRCIIADQMLKVAEKYRVVTMTHDEIVVIAKTKDAKKCLDFMIEVMSTPPEWAAGLPLSAEGGFDTCYSK